MARFIALLDFTEQGIRKSSETVSRADAFAKQAEKDGVKVVGQYWTVGGHDGVVILEAADERAVTTALLRLGAQGNVRTQTLRAFDRAEMDAIVSKVK